MKGEIRDEDRYAIGIVGSENVIPRDKKIAETFSAELASKGLTIVSGMARSIDTMSHKGALSAKGRSIAVLGSGYDTPCSPENDALLDKFTQNGATISEFPLGTPPNSENFRRETGSSVDFRSWC